MTTDSPKLHRSRWACYNTARSSLRSLQVGVSTNQLGPLTRARNLQLLDLSVPGLFVRSSSSLKELLDLRHLTSLSINLTGVLEVGVSSGGGLVLTRS